MDTFAVVVFFLFILGIGIYKGMQNEKKEAARPPNPHITCQHCHTTGVVKVTQVVRKKGISGGKATGAVLTGGVSMLATGLSRKEPTQHLRCTKCGMEWDA